LISPKLTLDAFSGAKLASMGFTGPKDKKRRLELHNPDENVSFEFTGKMWVAVGTVRPRLTV
jgi:hypothetical protein